VARREQPQGELPLAEITRQARGEHGHVHADQVTVAASGPVDRSPRSRALCGRPGRAPDPPRSVRGAGPGRARRDRTAAGPGGGPAAAGGGARARDGGRGVIGHDVVGRRTGASAAPPASRRLRLRGSGRHRDRPAVSPGSPGAAARCRPSDR
jgi:hypothetical protein